MTTKVPAYCLHRPTGQAYATVRQNGNRKPVYFGRWATADSLTRYESTLKDSGLPDDLIRKAIEEAKRLTADAGTQPPPPIANPTACTVRNLWAAFFRWAPSYYRLPTGQPSRELDNFKDAVRELLTLFGDCRTADFTKRDLEQVRQAMVDRGLSRGVVNKRINKIIRIFLWGTEQDRGLVSETVAALCHLRPLNRRVWVRPVVGVIPSPYPYPHPLLMTLLTPAPMVWGLFVWYPPQHS